MSYQPILTNKALKKMSQQRITHSEVIKAFNSSNTESTNIPGATQGIYHSQSHVIGAVYKKNHRGQYLVITCWKRPRYY